MRLFDDTLDQLYTWDLWAVAYIVQGGCSDDGFEYFRGWVISQGRRAHALALSDPGAFGMAIEPDSEEEERECEHLLYAGRQAYEDLTGEYGPDQHSDPRRAGGPAVGRGGAGAEIPGPLGALGLGRRPAGDDRSDDRPALGLEDPVRCSRGPSASVPAP